LVKGLYLSDFYIKSGYRRSFRRRHRRNAQLQAELAGRSATAAAEDGYEKMRDGLGWTMAISEATGQVVLTASGDQVAFVVFGVSLPF